MVTSGSGVLRAIGRRRGLVVALAAIYGMAPQFVQANPSGAVVVHGQAALQTQGNKLTVTNTPGAIVNWQQFSIGAGETTYFQQQNAASTVLNRVQAHNPALKSQIDGTLGSNGKVFLINPNGVVFGAGSVIDTQGFVASTLSLNDEDFKAGRFRFSRDGSAGDIRVQGAISSGNGDVYLIAPNVGTDGNAVIRSEGGNIVLAAGEMVEITGRNLNDITFAVQNQGNQVVNLGRLEGGAVGVFAGTLTHSGAVQARTVVREGGRLVLEAQGTVHLAAGSQVLADGQTVGGVISVASHAGNVLVDDGARISAQATAPTPAGHAASAGGRISVDAHAGYVALEAGSALDADAGRGGDIRVTAGKVVHDGSISADGDRDFGGSVRLQADSRLIEGATATVSARGVLRGGSITVAADTAADGTGHLFSSGTLDASASSGEGGSVTMTGRDVTLAAAQLRADGDAGGGTIRVGGGRAGADATVAHAQNLTVNAASRMDASARVDGDGGSIVTWADASNRFAGEMTARGGTAGGNGGRLEVSARHEVQFGGGADAGAPMGAGGSFLLDPKFIVIQTPVLVPGVSVELLDPNPGAGDLFGQNLQLLGNGNILVFNANDDFAATNSGAVYLYDGLTGALISQLRGTVANDRVGSGQVVRNLTGGNLLVSSPFWNGSAGALTTFNPLTGVAGTLSSTNSLVGAASGDQIGSSGTTTLAGGKFAIFSPNWNGAAGAITWADGSNGITGVVSSANSLVGALANDRVGNSGISSQASGKYYVATSAWNGSAGAVTWIDSAAPLVGVVGAGNSLVGGTPGDQVGSGGIYNNLISGKWTVFSPNWNGTMGAVTFMDHAGGTAGVVGAGNSLVGSAAGDRVGSGYWEYVGGKIAILSPDWANGVNAPMAGAITWFDTATIVTGAVSAANSLVGDQTNDRVGDFGVDYLDGTRYAIVNSDWHGNTGAVTWVDSTAPLVGVVSSANSLAGAAAGDRIGSGGVENFGYGMTAIFSPLWNGSMGAVTWVDTAVGGAGVVGAANSLVGSTAGDQVGGNGNYDYLSGSMMAIVSTNWANSASVPNAGAVTWVDASEGLVGAVSAANSLVGGSTNDRVGNNGVDSIDGTHYLARTTAWSGSAGAVTWIDSGAPAVGVVDAMNSLVGGTAGDQVGSSVQNLFNGKTLVRSPGWSANSGAVTWFDNLSGTFGVVDATNSLVGSTPGTTATGDRIGANSHQDLGNLIALRAPNWNNGAATLAGAVTFADKFSGVTGVVSAANSLVGSTANDRVGNSSLSSLGNGNYYLATSTWNGSAGAVTFVDPTAAPVTGSIGAGNSLVGGSAGDLVGGGGVQNLFNGKALVFSPNWNGGMGAVTWFDTTAGTSGTAGAGNSLVGSTVGDAVGSSGRLTVGSFVGIRSPSWDNGAIADAGAITWADAFGGIAGVVSSANSLVGAAANDRVGSGGADFVATGLSAVRTTAWGANAGAVTWINHAAPATGLVSALNSLVGSTPGDLVGNNGFSYGSGYVVLRSNSWSSSRGAVTWIDPGAPLTGVMSSANSLVGANPNDFVGSAGVSFMSNGNYFVRSTSFGGSAGAVTVGAAAGGISGVVSAANSLVGQNANDGYGALVTEISGSRLLVRASNADSGGLADNGRVHIYAGGAGGGGGPGGPLGGQAFSDNSASLITISPAQITAILNTGTAVSLQANSDITLDALSDIIVDNPSGDGGKLTLQAGRSVYLWSSILTDGGDLDIIANELTSNGVLTAHRDPGLAEIVMADGTLIDAGMGTVQLLLRDGADRTGLQAASSAIQMRSINAGTLVAMADAGALVIGGVAATAPSEIVVLGNASLVAKTSVSLLGGTAGAQALLSADGKITIESPDPQVDPAPILTLTNGGSLARIVNPPGTFPLILSGAQCIGCTVVSEFEITGANNSILDTITGANNSILHTITGTLLALFDFTSLEDATQNGPGQNEEDEIGIESGETCQ